jgi:hypothetical protein
MSDVIAPSKKVTFTVKKTPNRVAARKTIERLMRMQRSVQKGLKQIAKKRHGENYVSPRAGRMWMTRMPATKLVRAERGQSFTITITPQILPDLKAVEQYLDAKAAR